MTTQDVLRRIVELEEAKRERRWLAEQEAARTAAVPPASVRPVAVAASPRPAPRRARRARRGPA